MLMLDLIICRRITDVASPWSVYLKFDCKCCSTVCFIEIVKLFAALSIFRLIGSSCVLRIRTPTLLQWEDGPPLYKYIKSEIFLGPAYFSYQSYSTGRS